MKLNHNSPVIQQPRFPIPLLGGPALPSPTTPDTVTLDGDAIRRREQELNLLSAGGQINPGWATVAGGLRVETHKPNATLAVIDGFGIELNPSTWRIGPAHGEITSALALQASGSGESNLLRIDTGGLSFPPIDSTLPFGQNIDRFVTGAYTTTAQSTTDALREIRLNHPSITTVNQSEGMSGPSLVSLLAGQAGRDPEFAARLRNELGLPGDTNLQSPEAMVALANRVQHSLQNSPDVNRVQRNLDAELQRSQGHFTYVNSAGNSGQVQAFLADHGFTFDARFAGNAPAQNPLTQTVAATTTRTTLGGETTLPAVYSQQIPSDWHADGEVRPYMDGFQVCGSIQPSLIPSAQACTPYEGTSFAAPRIAGELNADSLAFQRLMQQALPPSIAE